MKMFNWKYKYFLKKIRGVEKMILDIEFKREKTRTIREEIRQEYDNLRSKLNVIEAQIKAEEEKKENKMPEGDLARLGDQKILIETDVKRMEAQIQGLDVEISGSKKCMEFPDGADGLTQQLDALRELITMLKHYIKRF